MSRLVDTIDINVPIEEVWDWFTHIDRNFRRWSPDHESFECLDGNLEAGSRVRYSLSICGTRYVLTGVIALRERTEGGFHIKIAYDDGLSSTHFVCSKMGPASCRLTYSEDFGMPERGLGRLANFFTYDLLAGPRSASREMLDEMRREGAFLKCILEQGIYPDREERTSAPEHEFHNPARVALIESCLVAGFIVGCVTIAYHIGTRSGE